MRVVIAPDSLKGTCSAAEAARALGQGWSARRPDDDVVLLPLADGGEGTLDALCAIRGAARRTARVTGPDGRPLAADWLVLPSGEAVVELAQAAGLALMGRPDPLNATTRGVGEVVAAAVAGGASSITMALGGSATTDGGSGALAALGLHLLDDAGLPLPDGGGALCRLARLDDHELLSPPVDGVRLLTDVTHPLLGPDGSAAVFAPQKGATPAQVRHLEEGLRRWSDVVGADPAAPGAGAAGGTAYGFAALWGAVIVPGAAEVARLVGLPEALQHADLVLTGEGCFDATSLSGKVVGHVLEQAGDLPAIVVAGSFTIAAPVPGFALDDLAGSPRAARTDVLHWLRVAGAAAAEWSSRPS